jgi:hypothetical protein
MLLAYYILMWTLTASFSENLSLKRLRHSSNTDFYPVFFILDECKVLFIVDRAPWDGYRKRWFLYILFVGVFLKQEDMFILGSSHIRRTSFDTFRSELFTCYCYRNFSNVTYAATINLKLKFNSNLLWICADYFSFTLVFILL